MLVGKKIGLRQVEKEDLEILKDWRNIQEFRRNFREHKELNSTNQENWYNKITNSTTDFMFVIIDLKDLTPVGACGLLYTNWIIRSADFSFYIGKDNAYIDDELAFDAANTLIKYGFSDLNLNKIWMELYEYDTRKLNFFKQKFNFLVDGQLRQNAFSDGKYYDSYIISLLSKEYTDVI